MNLPPEMVRYDDVESVSETFVDSVGLNSCDGHIARIELCVTRLDQFDPKSPPSKPSAKKYPACRLVMPMDTLARLAQELQRLLAAAQQQSARPPPGRAN
jgi:hypothetical protein